MTRAERLSKLNAELAKRILILDGSMGAYLQGFGLTTNDFHGTRFVEHPMSLKGDTDLLTLTQPHIITKVHEAYIEAGADIISTNTFTATKISQGEYALEDVVYEINVDAARLAREACDCAEAADGKPRAVAGSIGPTTKLLSMSPDVGDPGRRDADFDSMAEGYEEQILGLIEGGADILLIETITDTLNAKSALWGAWEAFDKTGVELPLWISGTITDRSGRTLSGQTVEAFYNSVRHANPWAVGLNCALGPADMRAFLADLARVAECLVAAYPNAGLPNAMGAYDETPHSMEAHYAEWARAGLLNIAGGCCGTTPDHITHMLHAVEGVAPRKIPARDTRLKLAGLEPFTAAA
ncbi:MAG TPA: homocysteine S-methyltransferase family protein [Vitreimonas sp.]|uniref:homocysteine S-methyltransferase family protein n=1 Tax=Vitreimonas sp. TaxID=3069702 RepID=UPI002D3E2655|nr:homocysteine S-methyltransferase family protein [Vitreimonas sp.]HYD89438.1 homocysteine S-methyltransferase family protein [Vitreimonas sp.]